MIVGLGGFCARMKPEAFFGLLIVALDEIAFLATEFLVLAMIGVSGCF
jgi:hypothetical protein